MAIDFAVEPEFQAELDWMDRLVTEEVEPLDLYFRDTVSPFDRTNATARTFPGNFLFSTGPNSEGGGKRSTTGHYDVPMRDCTVMLDNEVVIDKGLFADEEMIVEPVQRA